MNGSEERYENFTYEIGGNLYINLTSKCSNDCTFCVRNEKADYFGHKLWLSREPSARDVTARLPQEISRYKEYVFCGFGEPTIKLDVLLEVAKEIKARGGVTRINTNGQANMIHKRDVTGRARRLHRQDKRQPERGDGGGLCKTVPPRLRGGRLCGAAGLREKMRAEGHRHLVLRRGRHRGREDRAMPAHRAGVRRGAARARLYRLKNKKESPDAKFLSRTGLPSHLYRKRRIVVAKRMNASL